MNSGPQRHAFTGIAERTRRKITRRLMPFLFVLYIISYLDRVNLGYASLEMTHELGFSDKVFGFGAGIFFVGYFFLEIPSTILVELWSARKWIGRIMISWGLLASLTGLITTARQLYWFRFFLGMAEAGFFPGIIVYLTHWYRSEDRAKAIAMFMVAIPISQIVGAPVSGLLMRVHWWGYSGWRWLLILEGVPAVILGVVTIFYLTDWPRDARWLCEEERTWITGELEREKQAKKTVKPLNVWQALRNRDVVRLTLAAFFALTTLYGFGFWLPKIVQRLSSGSVLQVTLLSGIPFLAALPSMLLNGWHSDHAGERRWHAALSLLAAAALLLVASQSVDRSVTLAIVVLSGAAMGVYSYLPAFWSLPTTFLSEAAAAACIGLYQFIRQSRRFRRQLCHGFSQRSNRKLCSRGCLSCPVRSRFGLADIVRTGPTRSQKRSRNLHRTNDSNVNSRTPPRNAKVLIPNAALLLLPSESCGSDAEQKLSQRRTSGCIFPLPSDASPSSDFRIGINRSP